MNENKIHNSRQNPIQNQSQNPSQNPRVRNAQSAEMRPKSVRQSALFVVIHSDWTPMASTEAFILFSPDESTWHNHREAIAKHRQCRR